MKRSSMKRDPEKMREQARAAAVRRAERVAAAPPKARAPLARESVRPKVRAHPIEVPPAPKKTVAAAPPALDTPTVKSKPRARSRAAQAVVDGRFVDERPGCHHPACPCRERDVVERLDQHHVVYQQHVKRAGGDVGDPRNAHAMHHTVHLAHHRAGPKVPLTALADCAFEFAVETLGVGPAYEYLARRYAGEDPRLDALLG